jgi:hypothetical protein
LSVDGIERRFSAGEFTLLFMVFDSNSFASQNGWIWWEYPPLIPHT